MKYLELEVDVPIPQMEEFDFNNYYHGENTLISPALKKAGYILHGSWYSIEKDSFGPLSRGIKVTTPSGEPATIWYG